ncbi:ABC transporter permease [Pikeienuella piscinae]|uniref:ABC transporter permease n=1 Tax=Pikeienuella piscinae TaxID=2748098 RepID=A0A7L5BUH9_9RHOB|nr:ABC transporter permease [Pikeienuella piscinae]QIE54911.1 ABC transporter permease [Pikeienuella piscinae]
MTAILTLVGKRLALGLLTLFVVSVIIFAAIEALPGDFAEEILGQGATPEAVAAIRRDLGLDQTPVARYFSWLGGVVQGDFGVSFAQLSFAGNFGTANRDAVTVADQIAPRFSNTIFLASVAAAISVPLSLTLGLLAALYRGSFYDRFINVFTLSSISSPEFFVSYILILFLAVVFPVFPSISNINADLDFFQRLERTLLPALVLTLVVMAHMMRMTRAAIVNLLASPYIEMARLKGVKPWQVILRHALPNALAPIINVIALNLAYLVTGVVVVEVVFVYPGIGQLFVDAVKFRDMPIVQACCLIFAAAYILLNLTADVMSILTNPRLRHPK